MDKNQKLVVEWLLNKNSHFLNDIVELEGSYKSVPDEILDIFHNLTYRKQLEVVKKAVTEVLSKIPK